MKKFIFTLMLLVPFALMAQEETTTKESTVYVDGQKIVVKRSDGKIKVKVYEETTKGDTIQNDQIFEGVYMDGQSTERRMTVSIPFMKKRNQYCFEPHVSGMYIGYSTLYGDMGFEKSDAVDLRASKSWEIGINLFEGSLPLTNDRHWAITAGLGWAYTSFRLDTQSAFREINGETDNYPAPIGVNYSNSRLRYNAFRLPVSLEWQKRLNGRGPIFASIGAEAELRYDVKSKVDIDGAGATIGKDMNTRPLGINLLAQAGFDNIGVYARYATGSLFEDGKGPDLYPFSLGIFWHW